MHWAFQDKDNLFIVMDYLAGGDLRYHICKQKKFNEEQSKFFISCLLLGLEYLHFNNIIHRDIKPENLVFDHKGYLYLTDMGIAKLYRKDKTIVDSSGTPGYMSPEVIINQPHDLCSDFFAIGVMLHEFMFCKRPYVGKSRKEIKDQILSKEITIKVSDVPPGWSVEAADLINRLLKRRANQRLGKNGIGEIKDHAWLKDINWNQLYKKELSSPFIPKMGDNFDKNYCNKEDPIDKNTYGLILNKVNQENSFQSFYFNYYDVKSRDVFFELDGLHYTFANMHEEKTEKLNTQRGVSNLSSSIGLKMYENSTNLSQNLNASSLVSPKKSV